MARVGATQGSMVGVPAGGTTGQMLAKNSAVDGDISWRILAPLESAMAYQSNYWYCGAQRFFTTASAQALVAGVGYYCPVYLYAAVLVNALGFSVSSFTSGVNVNIGFSTCGADGRPATLLASQTIKVTSSATQTATFANTPFPAGWAYVYMGIASSSFSTFGMPNSVAPVVPCGEAGSAPSGNQPNVLADATGVPVSSPSGLTPQALANPPVVAFRVA